MAFEKLASFFGLDDDSEISTQKEPTEQSSKNNNIVALNAHKVAKQSEIQIARPLSYPDAKKITQELLNQNAVIVNFQQVNDEQMRRIADFLTGAVYALKGDIRQIDERVFLYTPLNFQIDNITMDFND